jgi:hypothetical protein
VPSHISHDPLRTGRATAQRETAGGREPRSEINAMCVLGLAVQINRLATSPLRQRPIAGEQ